MRLTNFNTKHFAAVLVALPLTLTACGDDVTGSSDTNDDSTGSSGDDTNTTNPSTTLTTTTDPGTTTDTAADSSSGEPTTDTTGPDTDGTTTDPGTSSGEESSSGGAAECGDGVLNGKEECDGDDLGDAACPVFGDIACADDCTLDLSGCGDTLVMCNTPAAALDGTTTSAMPLLDAITVAEDLFVTDVNVTVDITHPWIGDVTSLVIAPDATNGAALIDQPCGQAEDVDARFDDDGIELVCSDTPPAVAGDILPLNELRDLIGISAMGDWTLASWDNFSGEDDGTLNEWCVELTLSVDDPVTCGDDVAHYAEACDGADLNGADCTTLDMDFIGGTLGCLGDCSDFDTSMCAAAGCNGGIIDGDEVCDGDNLAGETCETIGDFSGGTLGCALDCGDFDTSMCTPAVCGNDMVEGAVEQCDGADLAGQDCMTLGGDGGTLSCANDCTLDTSMCTGLAECVDSDTVSDLDGTEDTFQRAFGTPAGCNLSGTGSAVFHDVYTFTAAAGDSVELSTCNQATFDSVLHVYQAADGSADPFDPNDACFNVVGINDDFAGCAGNTSQVTVNGLVAGEYQVVVTSFSNDTTGDYTLSLTCI